MTCDSCPTLTLGLTFEQGSQLPNPRNVQGPDPRLRRRHRARGLPRLLGQHDWCVVGGAECACAWGRACARAVPRRARSCDTLCPDSAPAFAHVPRARVGAVTARPRPAHLLIARPRRTHCRARAPWRPCARARGASEARVLVASVSFLACACCCGPHLCGAAGAGSSSSSSSAALRAMHFPVHTRAGALRARARALSLLPHIF